MTLARGVACALVVVAAAALAGCGQVESRHPASERVDSVVVPELFGIWQGVVDGDAEALDDDTELVFAVGRLRPEEPTIQVTYVEVKTESGETKVEKSVALATKIGERTYLSCRPHGEAFDGADKAWTILRYEMPDRDSVRLFLLDPERVAKEVEAGRLAGEVKREAGEMKSEKVSVRLSSSTADLRRFLAEHGDAILSDSPAKLRRVR